MSRTLLVLFLFLFLFVNFERQIVIAQAPSPTPQVSPSPTPSPSASPSASPRPSPSPEEPPVATKHQIKIGGKTLSYTATVGMMPIKNRDGETEARMFFMAYTLDGPS